MSEIGKLKEKVSHLEQQIIEAHARIIEVQTIIPFFDYKMNLPDAQLLAPIIMLAGQENLLDDMILCIDNKDKANLMKTIDSLEAKLASRPTPIFLTVNNKLREIIYQGIYHWVWGGGPGFNW